MKNTLLSQFTRTKSAVINRRKQLQAEMDEIDSLLAGATNGTHVPAPRGAAQNKTSLRETIVSVLKRPMNKAEILEAVMKSGYRFTTSDPANSLNALLYSASGKRAFKNQGGKFSVR